MDSLVVGWVTLNGYNLFWARVLGPEVVNSVHLGHSREVGGLGRVEGFCLQARIQTLWRLTLNTLNTLNP